MSVYTVHAPSPAGADLRATDKFVFVRDGFHFWAMLFGPWGLGVILLMLVLARRKKRNFTTLGSARWAAAEDIPHMIGASSGVGSAAIQIARQLGARVIATASSREKQDLALKLGAEHVVNTNNESWPAEVRKITSKHGVNLVVEHIGGKVLEQAFNCLARGGAIVTCGATAGREVTLNLWPFFVKEHRLIGSYGRNRADLERTLEWAAAGKLHPVIHRIFPLEETPRAFAALRDRTVLGKLVIRTAAR